MSGGYTLQDEQSSLFELGQTGCTSTCLQHVFGMVNAPATIGMLHSSYARVYRRHVGKGKLYGGRAVLQWLVWLPCHGLLAAEQGHPAVPQWLRPVTVPCTSVGRAGAPVVGALVKAQVTA